MAWTGCVLLKNLWPAAGRELVTGASSPNWCLEGREGKVAAGEEPWPGKMGHEGPKRWRRSQEECWVPSTKHLPKPHRHQKIRSLLWAQMEVTAWGWWKPQTTKTRLRARLKGKKMAYQVGEMCLQMILFQSIPPSRSDFVPWLNTASELKNPTWWST